MSSSVLIPVGEYLRTSYQPDREYIDGELKETNVGEESHAEIQAILTRILGNHRREWKIRVLTEVRVQTSETHYRVPDVCVVPASQPRGKIVRYAPIICIEILSPEDRMSDMMEKVDDYTKLGVKHIWVIDPEKRVGYEASPGRLEQAKDGYLRVAGTAIQISLAEVFAELDES